MSRTDDFVKILAEGYQAAYDSQKKYYEEQWRKPRYLGLISNHHLEWIYYFGIVAFGAMVTYTWILIIRVLQSAV